MSIIKPLSCVLLCAFVVLVFLSNIIPTSADPVIDTQNIMIAQCGIENKIPQIDLNNYFIAKNQTPLRLYKNIIIQPVEYLHVGEKAIIVFRDDEWTAILKNNKIFHINNLENFNIPLVIDNEEFKEETNPIHDTVNLGFQDVNKIMYVNTNQLNVRSGPNTKYPKIGTLNFNQEVQIVGIGNNNWNKIIFDGQVAYVYGSYLSNNKITQPSVPEYNLNNYPNSFGILKIQDLNFSVVLYAAKMTDNSQAIVDAKNSAAYLLAIQHWGMDIIADHAHQGFSVIKNAIPQSTIAQIETENGIQRYICVDKFNGKNTGYDLVDSNGESIKHRNTGGIMMYTCNPTHPNIVITFWQPC